MSEVKVSIDYLRKGARYLHVFLMFARHLTLSGYLVCYIS